MIYKLTNNDNGEYVLNFKKSKVFSNIHITHNGIYSLYSQLLHKNIYYKIISKYCSKCNKHYYDYYNSDIKICSNCDKSTTISNGEKKIFNYIKRLFKNQEIIIIQSDKVQIPPYELDIFIPQYSLAIEFNGLRYHSEKFGNIDKKYHLNKYEMCRANGITLLQIFNDEWKNDNKKIKQIIRQKLGIEKVKFTSSVIFNDLRYSFERELIDSKYVFFEKSKPRCYFFNSKYKYSKRLLKYSNDVIDKIWDCGTDIYVKEDYL